jgi:hypothetical protein
VTTGALTYSDVYAGVQVHDVATHSVDLGPAHPAASPRYETGTGTLQLNRTAAWCSCSEQNVTHTLLAGAIVLDCAGQLAGGFTTSKAGVIVLPAPIADSLLPADPRPSDGKLFRPESSGLADSAVF